jgi:RNA polymerase sigma-70 factor (ECF subfamily)
MRATRRLRLALVGVAPPAPGLASDEGIRAAYQAHGAELYRFALRQLGDEGRACDVVQEVFVRAWRSADRFDEDIASLRVWLFAIARNATIDEARRRAARPVVPVEASVLTGAAPEVEAFDEATMTSWTMEEALRRVGEDHRRVLVETHLRGRPHDEVARELGVPVGTVRSRVFYGLKALRLAMDEMGLEP